MNTYLNYLKAAAVSQINIVVFSGFALLSLVSWNLLPLFIGGIGEALWLGIAPLSGAFRNHADNRKKKELLIDRESENQKALGTLPLREQNRYKVLTATISAISRQYESYDETRKALVRSTEDRLEDLQKRYLAMLSTRATYEAYLSNADSRDIERKLSEITVEMNSGNDQIREVKSRQKEILEQRLEKSRKVSEDATLLNAQLESLEDLVKLLHEQSIALKDPAEINAQFDALVSQIKITDDTLLELDNPMESFDRQLQAKK